MDELGGMVGGWPETPSSMKENEKNGGRTAKDNDIIGEEGKMVGVG